MARDFQLAWPCPHLTVEEVVPLALDRRSLDCRQPVGAANTVRIMANDDVFIPQSGLFTPARIYGAISGPFDLRENEDDLTVATSAGTQTVAFGITNQKRLTASQIIKTLTKAAFNVAAVENINGHLVFTDTNKVGPESFIKVTGLAARALGFGDPSRSNQRQKSARGRQVYPGWTLDIRPDEITNRFPKFNERLRSNPVLKVTYAVPPHRCLRCGGTYIENDIRFDQAGQAILIANENLLYQAALKILLTDKGSNPYHPWYGTRLRDRIGSKALGGVASLISEDVRQALTKYQSIQEEQSKYQKVGFKERLYSVLQVTTQPHAQDPTTFLIDVVVQNASGSPIDLSIVFTVPEVVALMGSNGLFLGPEYVGIAQEQDRGLFGAINQPKQLGSGT